MIKELDIHRIPTSKSPPDLSLKLSSCSWHKNTFARKPEIKAIVKGIPLPSCILDNANHVILANERFDQLKQQEADPSCDSDLCKSLGCVYAKWRGGCGKSSRCKGCKLYRALEQVTEHCPQEGECSIEQEWGGSLDIHFWANQFSCDGEDYINLTVKDQQREKQRLKMDRIFFHDVLNTAAGVQWSAELMRDEVSPTERLEMERMLNELAERLVEEINAQRDYVLAQSGEYLIAPENVSVLEYLTKWSNVYRQQLDAKGAKLEVHVTPQNMILNTDPNLLRRVLVNLLKNATEASIPGETVHLSAVQDRSGKITFTVKNAAVMPERVRMQIMRHQVSTKGQRRGYGVESAIMLSEQYLGGELTFTSRDAVGTIFKVVLPPSLSDKLEAA